MDCCEKCDGCGVGCGSCMVMSCVEELKLAGVRDFSCPKFSVSFESQMSEAAAEITPEPTQEELDAMRKKAELWSAS